MRFEFRYINEAGNDLIEVWFTSSKEEFKLGTLQFKDIDGDIRSEICILFLTLIDNGTPLFLTRGRVK